MENVQIEKLVLNTDNLINAYHNEELTVESRIKRK